MNSKPPLFHRFRCSAIFISLFVIAAGLAFGQSTGTIQGTITDATGAAIPNATVTIHDNGTGVDRTITSDSAGLYAAPSLAVGTYKVEVKAPGMAAMVANNLELPVAATVTQNFSLSVAAASQVVEVEANAALLETTKVSNSTVVNQATVQEVPLNGRHFVDLALLVPAYGHAASQWLPHRAAARPGLVCVQLGGRARRQH